MNVDMCSKFKENKDLEKEKIFYSRVHSLEVVKVKEIKRDSFWERDWWDPTPPSPDLKAGDFEQRGLKLLRKMTSKCLFLFFCSFLGHQRKMKG